MYNIVRVTPRIGKTGGDVGVFLSNNIHYTVKQNQMPLMDDVCEYLVIDAMI